MKPKRFQLKSALIEVVEYQREDNINDVKYFFGADYGRLFRYQVATDEYTLFEYYNQSLRTLEKGDYILRNVDGRYRVISEAELNKYYYEVE